MHMQVITEAMKVYEIASAIGTAQASVEEAGKASMQLTELCDNLLKVCPDTHLSIRWEHAET